ncbi:hypothetical protein Y032_0026g1446 [Ancylostoma ceylanicum]|uniref:Uncharacterized protein n=1 Tax=Ancylostoma ceylanicum TaxID=53326 RepID=A0A016UTZ7_9BILA|nr:hypothetical protein Y032_0026g1446 [Ancylostoma ceylanicum]
MVQVVVFHCLPWLRVCGFSSPYEREFRGLAVIGGESFHSEILLRVPNGSRICESDCSQNRTVDKFGKIDKINKSILSPKMVAIFVLTTLQNPVDTYLQVPE